MWRGGLLSTSGSRHRGVDEKDADGQGYGDGEIESLLLARPRHGFCFYVHLPDSYESWKLRSDDVGRRTRRRALSRDGGLRFCDGSGRHARLWSATALRVGLGGHASNAPRATSRTAAGRLSLPLGRRKVFPDGTPPGFVTDGARRSPVRGEASRGQLQCSPLLALACLLLTADTQPLQLQVLPWPFSARTLLLRRR